MWNRAGERTRNVVQNLTRRTKQFHLGQERHTSLSRVGPANRMRAKAEQLYVNRGRKQGKDTRRT